MATRGRKTKTARTARPTPETPGLRDRWACPPHLEGEAKAAWTHVVDLLRVAGNLDRTDPSIVEAYAINKAMLREAQRSLATRGVLLTRATGAAMTNPACAVVNQATMRLKAICDTLQLCPGSSKFAPSTATATQGDDDEDKWGDMLAVVG